MWPKGLGVTTLLVIYLRCLRHSSLLSFKRLVSIHKYRAMFTYLPQTYLTMIPVMTSFLPPTHIHLYLPAIFKIWEAFNSTLLDDRLIDFVGELSEEHVAGTMGKAGEDGGAQWKDVGIWSETEWTVLMGKALGSMSMLNKILRSSVDLICPQMCRLGRFGCVNLLQPRIDAEYFFVDQGASTTGAYADSKGSPAALRIRKTTNRFCESARVVIGARLNLHPASLAKLVVYSMAVDAPVRSEASPSPGERIFPSRQIGSLAGSKAMESLDKFITSTESFFHPSNSGLWSLSVRQNMFSFFFGLITSSSS